MEIKSPLVSIVVPTYKPRFFEAALQSALLQTYGNIEILISDDCPGLDVQDILSRYLVHASKPIRIIRNEPGLGGLLNYTQCVTEARGQFVKFLNDDDILLPTCIERMVEVFNGDSSISLVTSRRLLIDGLGRTLPEIQATKCPFLKNTRINGRDLISYLADYPMNFIGEPSTVMFRREHLVNVTPNVCCLQGETIRAINDLAMYVNILTHGDLAYLVEPLSCFRQHEEQRQQQSDILELWKKAVVLFPRQIKSMGLYRSQGNSRVRISSLESDQWEEFDLQKVLSVVPIVAEQGAATAFSLQTWVKERVIQPHQQALIDERLSATPVVRVGVYILGGEQDAQALRRTLDSLASAPRNLQLEVAVLGQVPHAVDFPANVRQVSQGPSLADTLNECIEAEAQDWVVLLGNGVEFTRGGLHMLSVELSAGLPCDAVYADELVLSETGVGALFRPDFNLDLLLSLPSATARRWLFRGDALKELGGFDARYPAALEFDLITRLIEQKGISAIGHLDEPLLIADSISLLNIPDEVSILERHLQRRGYPNGKVVADLPGRYRLIYNHDDKPLVSIIVPTKDQLPMLLRCITSLLEKTRYPNFEVLIVDNNSETAEARDWLNGVAKMGADKVRVLRYPYPFNYSAINNMAAREARGEYLVLLNNDTAILREDWLEALMNHGQRPEVGIVGAKLLYPTGQIQHAGVILGLRGPADHPFIGAEQTDSGYMQRMQVDQNLTAVTAACLLIRKSIYEDVGGLDEEAFKVSYNDVDLCLKVREAGYLTVWTPHSVVMHVGSVSQNNVDPAKAEAKRKRFMAEQDAMYEKWLPLIARDPAYNANLSLNGKGFEIEVDANLTWRPLSWRPLPVVLAHMADKTGCGQYRVIQPFNAAKEAGLIDGTLSGRLLSIPELERYNPDSIVLQRQVTDAQLEIVGRMNKFSKAFKVFELDDYLPNLPIKSVHRGHIPKDILKSIRRGLGYVDRFVVSTEPLAEAFAGMHADIQVVKNRLDPRWWTGLSSERRVSDKPRVGWAGGSSHTGDLEMIADVVKELANEVEWVFFGMCPDKLRPYVHEFHPGIDIEKYPAALAGLNLDLALAPVEPNLFNECKSSLRLLEYGACGFPVVCTDLVCYQGDLPVTRVKNRFKDWVDAIRMHLSDLDATAKTGDELRAAVHKDWMLEGENLELWRKAWLPG